VRVVEEPTFMPPEATPTPITQKEFPGSFLTWAAGSPDEEPNG
jgi:hypothetical protein